MKSNEHVKTLAMNLWTKLNVRFMKESFEKRSFVLLKSMMYIGGIMWHGYFDLTVWFKDLDNHFNRQNKTHCYRSC
jgi:hypothetical protein